MVRKRTLAGLLLLTLGPVPLVAWLGDAGLRSLEERHRELGRQETVAAIGEALTTDLDRLLREPAVGPLRRNLHPVPLMATEAELDRTEVQLEPAGEALSHPQLLRAKVLLDEGREGASLEALGGLIRARDPLLVAVGSVEAAEQLHSIGMDQHAIRLLDDAQTALEPGTDEAWKRWVRLHRERFDGEPGEAFIELEEWVEEVCQRSTNLEELVLLGTLLRRFPAAEILSEVLDERRSWPRWSQLLRMPVASLDSGSRPALVVIDRGRFLVDRGEDVLAYRVEGLEQWCSAWRGESGARVRVPTPSWPDVSGASPFATRLRLGEEPASFGWPVDLDDLLLHVTYADARLFGPWNPRLLLFGGLVAYVVLALFALRALLVQERQSRRLAEARGDLIAEVTHELRTPLTVLRLYAESLFEKRVAPEAEREYHQTIRREAIRLGALVDRVAEAARDEEVPAAPREVIDPTPIVERVAEDFHRVVEGDGGEVAFEASATPARLLADGEELRRIVEILIDNAARYGGEPVGIDVAAGPEGDFWVLTIRDRGPGIAAGDRERIFERWVRGRNAAGRGAGMGLYLARSGARELGGELTLESAAGGGTMARLELPREPQP